MKTLKFNFVFMTLFLLVTSSAIGQNEKSTTVNIESEKSYTLVDINYISDAIFMGRKDSISAPYLFPSITYHHHSGMYAKGSFSYLTKKNESRVDLFLITAGYDFTHKKIYGDISATKYFFNEDSYNVKSEIIADLSTNFQYDLKIINLSFTANTFFNKSSSPDFFLSSEVSHDFVILNNKFQLSPNAGIYFGSQNFYEQYYIDNRFGSDRGKGQSTGSGNIMPTTAVMIQESEKFNVMAIEFSLPMWYTHKAFTLSFLPTLTLPQNEATLVVNEMLIKENLKETFYWMLGISYKFQ